MDRLKEFSDWTHCWLCYLICLGLITTVTGCEFPYEYQGHWYQSVLGEVTISHQNISKKGFCIENERQFYLLENSEIGCLTCIRMVQRHHNILQYQESYCVGKASLYRICSSIQPETLVHTLIREPARPVPCPFHGAYHFTYNNNSGGVCRSPSSEAKPCAAQSRYRFHFKHCPDAAYTIDREVELDCLADWSDDKHNYLVSRLVSRGYYTKEDTYRGFHYTILGTLVHVSMSADASFRGLRTSRDGPVVMEFTQDVFGWPEPSCTYPAWLTRNNWRDLSGMHTYFTNDMGDVIRVLYQPHASAIGEVHKAFRCHNVLTLNTSLEHFTVIAFVSHGCTTRFQCVKFSRWKDGVVEVQEGRYMEYDSEPCLSMDMVESNRRLLIPESAEHRSCPMPGRYRIETGTSVCSSYFRSGCNSSSTVDIVSSCSSKPGLELRCLKTWRDKKTRYLVASRVGDDTKTANCYSFRRKGDKLHFSVDDSCNIGTSYILRDSITYVLRSDHLSCDMENFQSDNSKLSPSAASYNRSHIVHGDIYKQVDDTAKPVDKTNALSEYRDSISSVAISHKAVQSWITILLLLCCFQDR